MKFRILPLLFALTHFLSCQEEPVQEEGFRNETEIFDLKSVPELSIHLNSDEWNTLLLNFDKNPANELLVECSFHIQKGDKQVQLNKCGLKIRGNTSRRRPEGQKGSLHQSIDTEWHHSSFSIDFNHFVQGQKLAGLKKLNLKWFKDDPMYVREIYCYDLFRRYGVWTAPRSSYCKLSIQIDNEESAYFGVYELLESVDDDFIRNRLPYFGDDQGYLWKCNWGADLVKQDPRRMDIEVADLNHTYRPVYDFKGDPAKLEEAKTALISFMDSLNYTDRPNFKRWSNKNLDRELILRTYAVNILCGMWDDYWINQNNYYIYMNSQGKFFFIPFDYDNTLGTSQIIPDAGRQDPMHWGSQNRPLITRFLSYTEYRSEYLNHLHVLCDPSKDYFSPEKSKQRINGWQSLIVNFIPNDTGEDIELNDMPASWGNCGFYRLLENDNNYFDIRSAGL